uniref:FA complementation group G n=1 Tax=Cyprinus carpio TaxID=7962 RepID=A0A8C1XBG0_CYPCA
MYFVPCLADRWSEENNSIILTCKVMYCSTERLELEMTVSYNTFLFSLSLSNHFICVLCFPCLSVFLYHGSHVSCSDPVQLWAVLQTLGSSVYVAYVHKLLLVQWMLWLMQCQLERALTLLMQTDHKRSAPVNLQTKTRNLALSMEEDSSLMVAMTAMALKDLLHICTVIRQGVEQMKMALDIFQEAKGLSSPRSLLAQIHTLTGQSFAKLVQPHCALHFYRMAVEVDCACHSALYQSALVFRQFGNPKTEMEALHLLYSAVQLQSDKSSSSASLVSLAVLLGGAQMTFISRVPSPSLSLHTLAHTCVFNVSIRISDGVEYYLDLLASLQSDGEGASFPRIPVVYLEAGFALLKAKRYSDALVVCEEVITSTLDFIPERLLFMGLLQAQAHWKLRDTKEAIRIFTRCIHLVPNCVGKPCFVKCQLKEALRDLHLCFQMTPGCKNIKMLLSEVLWRVDRREEESAHWREARSTSDAPKNLPLYLQLWPDDTAFDFSELKKMIVEYIQAKKT